MAWKGVITDAGAELITRWAANATLKISHALAGTGTVDETTLVSQSALVQYVQNMSIVSGEAVEGGTRVKVQITAPEEEYVLNQIGLFATIEDSEPVLLALYQNNKGVLIPNQSDAEDFVFSFLATIAVGSSGNLQIIIDSAAVVSQSTLAEAISAHNNETAAHPDMQMRINRNSSRIGDIRITANTITDDDWLLCQETKITEEEYPELYYRLASKTDIFIGEWNIAEVQNGGYAPILASDGYLYFFKALEQVAYKCLPDYSNWETFNIDRGYANSNFRFIEGPDGETYWVATSPGDDGVYQGYISYIKNSLNNSAQTVTIHQYADGVDPNSTRSFTRYDKNSNRWLVGVCVREEYGYNHLYASENINGPYTSLSDCYGAGSEEKYYDCITFKNGACIKAFDSETNNSFIMSFCQTLDTNRDEAIEFFTMTYSPISYPTYVDEEDIVVICTSANTYVLFSNGTIVKLGMSASSFAYFKGYLYFKVGEKIRRYLCAELSLLEYEETSNYTYPYEISAAGGKLFAPKDTETLYYIENTAELSIPETHPGTIFKTYIKCK